MFATFPKCFSYKNPLPLKKRIEADIYSHLPKDGRISKLSIKSALAYYTKHIPYLHAILSSQHRIDLQGNFVTEVTDCEKEYTQQKLDDLKAKRTKKDKKSTKHGDKFVDK